MKCSLPGDLTTGKSKWMRTWVRLKHVADVVTSNVDKLRSEAEIPVRLINYTDVYYRDRLTPELPLMRATASASEIARHRVLAGDILITKDSETRHDIGVPAYVESTLNDMVCGYHLSRIRTKKVSTVHPRYLFWALTSDEAREQMIVAATGITRFGLRTDSIRNIVIRVPSLHEQMLIAHHLDTKTGNIDALIAKKRRMAELSERRLVSFATQLVNGDNRSQLSGIPSIPFIPSRWQSLRNKVFMRETHERSSTGEEELLSVSHLTGVTPRSQKTVYMFKAESMVGYKLVRPGDLAVNTMWAWMGAAGVSKYHGIVSPSYGVYRIDQTTMHPGYFDMLVRTPAYICEMTRYSRGITSSRLRLYPDELLSLRTPVPPMDEQQEIVRRFEGEASRTRSAIGALGRQVGLLTERRQALITAAVTGQLAVPGVEDAQTYDPQ